MNWLLLQSSTSVKATYDVDFIRKKKRRPSKSWHEVFVTIIIYLLNSYITRKFYSCSLIQHCLSLQRRQYIKTTYLQTSQNLMVYKSFYLIINTSTYKVNLTTKRVNAHKNNILTYAHVKDLKRSPLKERPTKNKPASFFYN